MIKKKIDFFCQKGQNFVYFETNDLVQILPAWSKCVSTKHQVVYGETLDFQCFDGKFTAKIGFRSIILCYHY